MKATATIISLVSWCTCLLVTASPQTVTNVTVYKPDKLDSQVSRTFLDCLTKTGVEYKVYVDEGGTTVVLPTEQRETDFDGEDQELLKCIIAVNDRMDVAVESTIEYDDKHENAILCNSATHEWLSEQGAKGKAIAQVLRAAPLVSFPSAIPLLVQYS
ncbi:hypothetical protein Plec18170_006668 [Paecilomyces lecythidis]